MERARDTYKEDLDGEVLSPERAAEFQRALERLRRARRFAAGRNESPEAEARRKFFEQLDRDDV